MRRRADLLIFVFVSRALEHREDLPHVQVQPPGPVGLRPQARFVGVRLMIDELGITWYTLCYDLNADGQARWSPGSWTGSLRAA